MTIEEAKRIYTKYDCSMFAMGREEKEAYDEYKALNISNSVQEQWRQELFVTLLEEVKLNGEESIFIRLYNLTEPRYSKEKISELYEALNFVKYKDLKSKAYVCEAVLGRKDISERSGMIFGAYDLGERDIAKKLLLFVYDKLTSEIPNDKLTVRIDRDINKCHALDCELGLGIYNNS